MWIAGGYTFKYTEEKKRNSYWDEYEKVVSVYTPDNELVLSSKGRDIDEFINYLGFLTNEEVVETAKELLEKGRTKEDDVRDFIELCGQHDHLWN